MSKRKPAREIVREIAGGSVAATASAVAQEIVAEALPQLVDFGAASAVTVHGLASVEPAALPSEPTSAPPASSAEQREPNFMWGGRPVYRCRSCGYERVENLGAVLKHEAEAHAKAPEVVRESRILGLDGQPLIVEERGQDNV